MAAGLGFKDFVTGEVLTAADVDGYLMQGVWVFASAAARDAAVTSPQEGNFAYLKDTNVTTYYTGSAWANLDTTGMTNPMTTTGDTIYSSSGSTPARLGIGSTGQILTVAGGVPSWATASSGGMTLINSGGTALTGASVTISSIPQTYNNLQLVLRDFYPTSSGTSLSIRINGASGSDYQRVISNTGSSSNNNQTGQTSILLQDASADSGNADVNNSAVFNFYDYTQALRQNFNGLFIYTTSGGTPVTVALNGSYLPSTSAAITSLEILVLGGTLAGGTALLYGVK